MKHFGISLAILAGVLAVPASANEKYMPLGNLNCVAAPGTADNAMVCKFQTFKDGNVEVYVALAEEPGAEKPPLMRFKVVSTGVSNYRKGGLSGDYVARGERGTMIGKENPGLILQPALGAAAAGPSVVRLEAAK